MDKSHKIALIGISVVGLLALFFAYSSYKKNKLIKAAKAHVLLALPNPNGALFKDISVKYTGVCGQVKARAKEGEHSRYIWFRYDDVGNSMDFEGNQHGDKVITSFCRDHPEYERSY